MDFDRNHVFEYASAESVAPGLLRVTAPNPGPLTFHGTGTYLIGNPPTAMIDPGPPIVDHANALMTALNGQPLAHIVVTHGHNDHAGLAAMMKTLTGAAIAAFDFGASDQNTHQDVNLAGETENHDFITDIPLTDGSVIEGPGYRLEAVHTPGHTGDHLCFVDHAERRVFCGDHIMAWSTTVILPPDGHVGRYIESLERLLEFEDFVFWPTHGPPVKKPATWIRQLIAHREERQLQIVSALTEQPVSADVLLKTVYRDLPPNLTGAALQSLLAGLNWLIEQGQALIIENETRSQKLYYRG
ncbi:MAG: MBL fold metallo-hydrolase [marine bacterium B5-7]|nr:MAG: MBL fold metallo-hydrolase [marine bacterium B5-7]